MIAVIRPVLAKERLAKLFYHKNTFAGQAGTENRFDQELITDSALALASLKKTKQKNHKTNTKNKSKESDHSAKNMFSN